MSEYQRRLESFEQRLRELEAELAELRRAAVVVEEPPAEAPKKGDFWGFEGAESLQDLYGKEAPAPAPAPAPPRAAQAPASPEPPPKPPRTSDFDLAAFLGARALAATGGVVSLLGIVFFFALAVERGWIGPGARVTLGALASVVALGAGWWLRRRFGETYASVAAAAAGIAGGYATLLVAAARYDLVPDAAALVLAAAIAGAATYTALAWSDELLAGIGLVGAILAPLAVAIRDDRLATTGVGFAALMLAAAIAVALTRTWYKLLVVAAIGAGLQIASVLDDSSGRRGWVLVLAIVFWILYGGTGVAEALRRGRLTRLSGWFVVVGAAFSGYAAAALYDGDKLGTALLLSALVNTGCAAYLFRRARDLASLLWATALALAAIGTAELVSGATLTMAWAAEAAVLAWLAVRLLEPRFRLAAFGWLGLALVHTVAFDSPPTRLVEESDHPAAGVPSLLALIVAMGIVGWLSAEFAEEPGKGYVARLVNEMRRVRRETQFVLYGLGGVIALDAASLCVLAVGTSWDWSHVAVTSLWGLSAIGLMLAGQRLPGVALTAATVVLALGYDVRELHGSPRWFALAAAGAAALVTGLLYDRDLQPVTAAGVVGGGLLVAAAALASSDGDLQWLLLLALAAAYLALGAAFLRLRRDQSTMLWATGLVFALVGFGGLLDHFWLALAWASTAAVLALLARFEDRLDPAALAFLSFALLELLIEETPPSDLFVSHRHPAAGVPAALVVLGAIAVYAWLRTEQRVIVVWVGGVLAVYAASLSILELFESFGGSVDTSFQRGHTAVSALWGLIGLALLYFGLIHKLRVIQLGGFALFGVSLAKLFLYDLAFLSSVTRAFSFLAIGAVLIAGGFFYQRLAAAPE